jgi:hypothetical protein
MFANVSSAWVWELSGFLCFPPYYHPADFSFLFNGVSMVTCLPCEGVCRAVRSSALPACGPLALCFSDSACGGGIARSTKLACAHLGGGW